MASSLAELTPLTERQFQQQICELAELRGWEWMHPRAGRTVDSWRTPMSGTMAQGWPDLVLIKAAGTGYGNWTTTWLGRVLFVEVKTDAGKLTVHQERVLDALRKTPAEVFVWRPKDWDEIERTLR